MTDPWQSDSPNPAEPSAPPAVLAHARQASRLVATRYPGVLAAVLGGSTARGSATPTSDLDIAVLLPDDAVNRRETLRHEGRLAEVFLHSRAGLREIFASDRSGRRATMLFIYAESVPLHDPEGHAEALRAQARAVLAAGPDALTAKERELGRYRLTDLLDDLTATTIPGGDRYEQLAVADAVLRDATHLLTAHHRAWNGAGKWLPRRLAAADPVLGRALLDGHLAVARQADPEPLAAAGRRVLDLLGGPLREGYADTWRTAVAHPRRH